MKAGSFRYAVVSIFLALASVSPSFGQTGVSAKDHSGEPEVPGDFVRGLSQDQP